MVAAGGRDFERAFRRLLAFDVLEIGHRLVAGIGRRLRPAQGLQSLEVVNELKQVLRREDGHVGSGPRGFGPARSGTDQPLAERVRTDRGGQRAGDGSDRSVERQLAENAEALDRVAGNGAGRGHQPEHDRQIVMAAFLRQIGGSEIDGDAFRRESEPDGVQRPAHPLAALRHGLVGKADDGEGGQPRSDLDLNINGARLDAPSKATVVTRANMARSPPFPS
jgi:hypothetical protein